MPHDIHPFLGVGPYLLGSSRAEVEAKHGVAPHVEINDIVGRTKETRDGLVLHFRADALESIRPAAPGSVLRWNGVDLMSDPGTLAHVATASELVEGASGRYVLAPDLGLALGGFGAKRIPEKRMVIVFGRERLGYYRSFIDM